MAAVKRALPFLALALALGVALFVALRGGRDARPAAPDGVPESSAAPVRDEPEDAPAVPELGAGTGATEAALLTTRVYLWRMEEPGFAAGRATVGSGRGSVLTGRTVRGDVPLANTSVEVVGGLDLGSSARTAADGSYALTGLRPGLILVAFEPPGHPKFIRQVLLRRGAEERLDIDVGDFGNVRGTVRGVDGKPIRGARVELDGVTAETGEDGAFYFSGVVPGECILYMSAPGHEMRRAVLPLRPSQALEAESNGFILRPAEALTVTFDLLPVEAEPPLVILLPSEGQKEGAFPFERHGVHRLRPGDSSIRIEGIPINEPFQLRAAGPGGVAVPAMRPVHLRSGDTNLSKASFKFVWKAPLRGRVVSGGNPLTKACVRVESADLARATEEILREGPSIPPAVALPPLPFVKRTTRVADDGSFQIETGDVPWPFLLVVECDGFEPRVLPVRQGATDVGSLELTPAPKPERSRLAVEFQRSARRRVQAFVDGAPSPPRELEAGEGLELAGLEPGSYAIRVLESSDEDSFPAFERRDVKIPAKAPVRVSAR